MTARVEFLLCIVLGWWFGAEQSAPQQNADGDAIHQQKRNNNAKQNLERRIPHNVKF